MLIDVLVVLIEVDKGCMITVSVEFPLTLKAPITTAADNIQKYFLFFLREK